MRAKKALECAKVSQPCKVTPHFTAVPNTVVTFDPGAYYISSGTASISYAVQTPVKKEETMYTETQTQRNYLETRLRNIYASKRTDLNKQFHIDRYVPSSFKEALEKIKTGKFSFDEKRLENLEDDYGGEYFDLYCLVSLIDWDLEPADKAGFKAAEKLLDKAYTDAKDQVTVASPEKGLEALKAFEGTTFH